MLNRIASVVLLALLTAHPLPSRSQEPSPSAAKSESHPPQTEPGAANKQPQPDQRGTAKTPLMVELLNTGKDREETEQDKKREEDQAASNRWIIGLTGALAIGTFLLFGVGVWQAVITRRSIRDQFAANERTIKEAGRSADSIASVADSMTINTGTTRELLERQKTFAAIQLRAYISIQVGGCVPQDRVTGWKYEIRMLITNTGHTPAKKLVFNCRAKIFPFPLPQDIDLTLPLPASETGSDIASRNQHIIRGWLNELISDDEIFEITNGTARKLYVYGTVRYFDVFDGEHYTNFCQYAVWDVKGLFSTMNAPRHNDAT